MKGVPSAPFLPSFLWLPIVIDRTACFIRMKWNVWCAALVCAGMAVREVSVVHLVFVICPFSECTPLLD